MRIERNMRALVEWRTAHRFGGLAAHPDGHQDFTIGGALSDGMVEHVGEPHAIVGTNGNAVGARKDLLVAPAMQKLAAAIQNNDWRVAAIEHEDIALWIARDAGGVVRPPVGHFAPFFD